MNRNPMRLVVAGLLISACAVNKTPVPTGGSRADGIIKLSYEVRMFEKPVVDWNSARRSALQRCQAWGYTRTEAFAGEASYCHAYNGYGTCVRATVTKDYQCIE